MPMDMVYYEETTESCGYSADGIAMFDPLFRPEQALVAPDGTVKVTVDGNGEGDVMHDVRPLEPTLAVGGIKPAIAATVDSDGAYPVTLPGGGCFVVTIGWQAEGRSAKFTSLVETVSGACRSD